MGPILSPRRKGPIDRDWVFSNGASQLNPTHLAAAVLPSSGANSTLPELNSSVGSLVLDQAGELVPALFPDRLLLGVEIYLQLR